MNSFIFVVKVYFIRKCIEFMFEYKQRIYNTFNGYKFIDTTP